LKYLIKILIKFIMLKIDKTKEYSLEEALDLIKKNPSAKFEESIEIHLRLGINPKKTEQQVKGTVILPHGLGKEKKIAAFVTPEKEEEAKKAGADIVGGTDLIEQIKKSGKCEFDLAVAEPALMKDLAQIARILGPKGLMPSPKNETVTTNIGQTIKELKKGKITFKNDDSGVLHQVVGKISWPLEKLKENIEAFIEAVRRARPAGIKGNYFRSITLCSTMGPGIKIKL